MEELNNQIRIEQVPNGAHFYLLSGLLKRADKWEWAETTTEIYLPAIMWDLVQPAVMDYPHLQHSELGFVIRMAQKLHQGRDRTAFRYLDEDFYIHPPAGRRLLQSYIQEFAEGFWVGHDNHNKHASWAETVIDLELIAQTSTVRDSMQ